MSDTPRTDFVAHESGDPEWNRFPNRFARMMAHACILERELSAEQERATKAEKLWFEHSCYLRRHECPRPDCQSEGNMTAPKMQPGTPLPWRTHHTMHKLLISNCEAKIACSILLLPHPKTFEIDTRSQEKTAAYITHTANSYPALVAALKAMCNEHGNAAYEGLLRDLGEL